MMETRFDKTADRTRNGSEGVCLDRILPASRDWEFVTSTPSIAFLARPSPSPSGAKRNKSYSTLPCPSMFAYCLSTQLP